MRSPRVVHINDRIPGAQRVDRRTPWGNPYRVGVDGSRDEVCDKFKEYAARRSQEEPDWLTPLKGKDLACWCAPKRCHAETLLAMANGLKEVASHD